MIDASAMLPALKELYAKNGWGFKEFNLFGFRNPEGTMDDVFNDVLGYATDSECFIDRGTTDPGRSGILNPVTVNGVTGAAFLAYGFHKGLWRLGFHGINSPSFKHEAWVQVGSAPVHRDRNKNGIVDEGDSIMSGVFGINRHRASKAKLADHIGPYSIGCQVYLNAASLESEITRFKSTTMYKDNPIVKMDYALMKFSDIGFDVRSLAGV